MSTYTQMLFQIVFRTKNQIQFLNDENENVLFGYIAGILKNKNCHSYIVGGANEHIHIITHIHPTIAPAYLIKDIKLASSEMMKINIFNFRKFSSWQSGYGLFTYHAAAKNNLINYVNNQKEHHRKISYIEEYQLLLQEHLIDYKYEYLFD